MKTKSIRQTFSLVILSIISLSAQENYCPKKFTLLRDRSFSPVINNLIYTVNLDRGTTVNLKEENLIESPEKNICYCDYEIEVIAVRGNEEISTSLLFEGFVEYYWFPSDGDPSLCAEFSDAYKDGFSDVVVRGEDDIWAQYGDIDKLVTWAKIRRYKYPFGIMNAFEPDKDFDQNELAIGSSDTPGYGLLLAKAMNRSCTNRGYLVNSTGDDGLSVNAPGHICTTGKMITVDGQMVPECTLRAAIELNNRDYEGTDQTNIAFGIPDEEGIEIQMTSALPNIMYPVFIDGSTQTGGTVLLDGTNAGQTANGLSVLSNNCTIHSLIIEKFDAHGIFVLDNGSTKIDNCTTRENLRGIVLKNSSRNLIHNSLVYNNRTDGILVNNPNNSKLNNLTENVIAENFIGTNKQYIKLPNEGGGIKIQFGYGDEIVGNQIWNNKQHQIEINNSKNIDISKNDVLSGEETGVFASGSNDVFIHSNSLRFNKRGIENLYCSGVLIYNNGIDDRELDGINMRESKFKIFQNEIDGHNFGNGNGIKIRGERSRGSIFGNVILRNKKYGIAVESTCENFRINKKDCAVISLVGNSVKENSSGGLSIKRAIVVNHLNEIIDNLGNTGIHVNEGSVYGRGNLIERDESDGIYLSDSSDGHFEFNNIANNSGFGIFSENSNESVIATNNWWGDPSGPSGIANGTGDKVSEYIDYSEWRVEPIGLIGASLGDTIYVPVNEFYSFDVFVQNWNNLTDEIVMEVTDQESWIYRNLSQSQTLDSLAANFSIDVYTYANDAESEARFIFKSSQDPSETDTLEVLLLSQMRELRNIELFPDTINLMPGDSVQFFFEAFDQFSDYYQIDPLWSASGGTIDQSGLYIAEDIGGMFEAQISDPVSGIESNAIINIEGISSTLDFESDFQKIRIIKVFPNPFADRISLNIQSSAKSKIEIGLSDIKGQMVFSFKDYELDIGLQKIPIADLKDLNPGEYFVLVKGKKNIISSKIIKI